jgi:glycosyltransferase involved in cell wall biosynthesis
MRPSNAAYLLVTAARNEEAALPGLIECIRAQTVLPVRWIIVSDGSTDGTDAIAARCASEYPWIKYVRRAKPAVELKRVEKVSPGKASAIELALEHACDCEYEFFACLDADVSMPNDYYEKVIGRLLEDPRLGLAGGAVYSVLPDGTDLGGGFTNPHAVSGAVQVFRRQCYEDIGGLKPYGHDDCIACEEAEAAGWGVRTFLDIRVVHHAPEEGYARTVRSKVPVCFYLGKVDYIARVPLWFEVVKSAKQSLRRPYLLAGASLLCGYLCAMCRRMQKIPSRGGVWERHRAYVMVIVRKLCRLRRQSGE